jgi:F-type H+-transporting ATPase subunit delta
MTSRAAANRYARALFDVAQHENVDTARLLQDLASFATLFTTHEDLMRTLSHPAIPASKKRGVIDQLLPRVSVSPMIAKLLRLLADRDRLGLVPEIATAFETRVMDQRRVVRAEVVTAMELPADRLAALREGLGRATGREVQLHSRVDSSIIGGAVARIGSTVYDGSVTRQLERLKQSLVEAAQ